MRSQRLVGGLAAMNLALLAVLLLGGTTRSSEDAVPAVVRAQALELVDDQGNVRAQLFLGADGGGNLRLRAPNGEVRVKIGATNDGGGLMFADKRTEPVVQLRAGGDAAILKLIGPDNQERVIGP